MDGKYPTSQTAGNVSRCVHGQNGRVDVSGLASCQESGTGDEISVFFIVFWTRMMEKYPNIKGEFQNINQCKSRKCVGSGSRKTGGFGIMYDFV